MPQHTTIQSVLLCYDIAHPKRLQRVAKAAEQSGLRIQKSVCECSLNNTQWLALRNRLQAHIHPDEDHLLHQPVCPQCRRLTTWHGLQPASEYQPYWVV